MAEQQQSEQQDRAIAQERTVATREPSQLRGLGPDGRVSTIAHTPTPWAYRPQEHDDWGVIRTTVVDANGWHPAVAVARYVGNPTDEDLGEHRRNKTDPSEANAAFIVRACNSHDALVEALQTVVSDCQLAFDALGNSPAEFDSVRSGFGIIADRARAALASAQAAK